jgi:hypothetical protein
LAELRAADAEQRAQMASAVQQLFLRPGARGQG